MTRGFKTSNEYAKALGELYEAAPKAVLAAIAVSYASAGGDHLSEAPERILKEWWVLHHNRIVPQKPPAPEPEDT